MRRPLLIYAWCGKSSGDAKLRKWLNFGCPLLTLNAFGAVGYQWNRTFSTELGYRYLYVDYAHDGFVFDAATKGLFLGATFKF